jgi:predicted aspartyl protease
MQLVLREGLPFVTLTIAHRGASVDVPNVLVDTGAASTVVNADVAAAVGIVAEHTDRLRKLRGVGGHEFVFVRQLDRLSLGLHGVSDFDIEIGEMDYGFDIDGILGMDFLTTACAIIDLGAATMTFGNP